MILDYSNPIKAIKAMLQMEYHERATYEGEDEHAYYFKLADGTEVKAVDDHDEKELIVSFKNGEDWEENDRFDFERVEG